MSSKKTLVIGASENPARYANIAINRLLGYGHEVVAIGNRAGEVQGVRFDKEKQPFTDIDTVTLYLRPELQKQYYDYIIGLHPKRVIFNPGTENSELEDLLSKNSIKPIEACTLVMLSTSEF